MVPMILSISINVGSPEIIGIGRSASVGVVIMVAVGIAVTIRVLDGYYDIVPTMAHDSDRHTIPVRLREGLGTL